MTIAALMLVRDEDDVLEVNLRHHLDLVDEVFVVDNGSSDRTPDILRRVSRRSGRLHWTRDDGPYLQRRLTTQLAQEARKAGADWVVSVDADEFWVTTGGRPLAAVLDAADHEAGALEVEVRHFVQARWVERRHPRNLLTMTRRSADPVGPPESAPWFVANRHASYVETAYAPKLVCRATEDLEVGLGNHTAAGLSGEVVPTEDLLCLHAPLRSREHLLRRANSAHRVENEEFVPGTAWQPRRWARLDAEELEEEWRANSYGGELDLSLDVHGYEHPVIVDTTLRDTVLPYFSLADRAAASLAWRRHVRAARRSTVRSRQSAG